MIDGVSKYVTRNNLIIFSTFNATDLCNLSIDQNCLMFNFGPELFT